MLSTPFAAELRDWRPDHPGHDDGLDAVAACVAAEPVRLPRRFPQSVFAGGVDLRGGGTRTPLMRTPLMRTPLWPRVLILWLSTLRSGIPGVFRPGGAEHPPRGT